MRLFEKCMIAIVAVLAAYLLVLHMLVSPMTIKVMISILGVLMAADALSYLVEYEVAKEKKKNPIVR